MNAYKQMWNVSVIHGWGTQKVFLETVVLDFEPARKKIKAEIKTKITIPLILEKAMVISGSHEELAHRKSC